MAWLSRVNFIASDTLSFSDINNLGNDIRAWGGNVNGGGYTLSNVVLSASAGTMATVTGGTGAASTLTIQSTSGAGSSDAIIFKTASQSERMRILTTGEVGIGTASPYTVLHTEAATNTSTTAFNVYGIAPAAVGQLHVKSSDAFTTQLGGRITLGGNTAASGSNGNAIFGAIEGFKTNSTTANVGGGLYLKTTPNATGVLTTVLTISGEGNVGIGTTGPGNKLSVVNTAITTSATIASFLTPNLVNGNRIATMFGRAESANEAAFLGYTPNATGNQSLLNLGFFGASDLVNIRADGNVGIGTTSPQYKLHVVGNIALGLPQSGDTSASASGGQILFGDSLNAAYGNRVRGHDNGSYMSLHFDNKVAGTWYDSVIFRGDGNVGIGLTNPAYKLEINTDSAGKPGVGGLWTVVSDERIKTDIIPADLDRCYEIVKSVPLKHFGFAPGVYTDDQINDKHSLGWIAQDVQKVFSKAVSVKPFTLKTAIPDGTEEYTEQDFTLETLEKTETSIEIIDGKPVQVSKVVTSENKVVLFDSVDVVDEAGAVVMDGDKPLTYQMPRMITKTRNKVRHDVIEDCLDLNGGQMIAALYGAVQALMLQVESLKAGN